MVDVPVRLHWSCGGKSGVSSYTAIAMAEDGEPFSLSEYWWFEGNGSCDCNRAEFCGLTANEFPDLFWKIGDRYPDSTDVVSSEREMRPRCGDSIVLTKIESLDPLIPSLEGEQSA